MDKVLFDQVIDTDYGQFDLMWDESYSEGVGHAGIFEQFFKGQTNGLVGASDPAGIYVHFGRRAGGSDLRIVLLDAAPHDINGDTAWEDVVEVSFSLPWGKTMRWSTWGDAEAGFFTELPPGSYRLRASERGRDEGHDGEFAENVVDWYLLELWPAPPGPDEILRTTSLSAQYWHRTLAEHQSPTHQAGG